MTESISEGIQDSMTESISDIIVIGGGPVGMFASFYGGMRSCSVKLIESMPQLGGQLAALYPEKNIYDIAGFPAVTAQQLVNNLEEQMNFFPIDICLEERVLEVVKLDERLFSVVTNKTTHLGRSIVIAGGVGAFQPKRLELPNSLQYEEQNLYYFIKDAKQFEGKKVLIQGGGDSAVDWALMLESIAEKVTLIHRRDKFRAHEHSVTRLMNSSVQVMTPWEVSELKGKVGIEQVKITHCKSGEEKRVDVDAVIVSFGFLSSLGPIAEWGIDIEQGSILVDSKMETNIPGIFAAGDITTYPGKLKLIAVGFGEAPTAINNAKVYIEPTAKLSPGHSSHMKR